MGGDYFAKDFAALNTGGRITYVAARGGAEVSLDLALLMRKRAAVMGSTLRARGADEKARLAAAIETTVWPWLAAGVLRPQMDQTFPLAQAAAAHARMESG